MLVLPLSLLGTIILSSCFFHSLFWWISVVARVCTFYYFLSRIHVPNTSIRIECILHIEHFFDSSDMGYCITRSRKKDLWEQNVEHRLIQYTESYLDPTSERVSLSLSAQRFLVIRDVSIVAHMSRCFCTMTAEEKRREKKSMYIIQFDSLNQYPLPLSLPLSLYHSSSASTFSKCEHKHTLVSSSTFFPYSHRCPPLRRSLCDGSFLSWFLSVNAHSIVHQFPNASLTIIIIDLFARSNYQISIWSNHNCAQWSLNAIILFVQFITIVKCHRKLRTQSECALYHRGHFLLLLLLLLLALWRSSFFLSAHCFYMPYLFWVRFTCMCVYKATF